MILQALYSYYELLLEQEGDGMPRPEYSSADVSFEIHLEKDGIVSNVIAYVNEKGKVAKSSFNVPKQQGRPGKQIAPYFLCDKAEYLFGAAIGMRAAYRDGLIVLWQDVLSKIDEETPESTALKSFLNWNDVQLSLQLEAIDDSVLEQLRSGGLVVIKYAPTGRFIHEIRSLQQAWEKYYRGQLEDSKSTGEQICLITGETVPGNEITRLHNAIKNVEGAQSSGALLVSFDKPSSQSFGREQSYNAPTSKRAADAYSYVLNRLLADPRHKVRMNDMTVVYWADSGTEAEQNFLTGMFQERGNDYDHDNEEEIADAESIRTRLESVVTRIRNGQSFQDTFADLRADTTFYVLGLSPNAARLSVRFWYTGTLGEMGERLWQHYRDLSIIGLDRSPTIRELLRELAVGFDWKNIPPNMEGQMFRSLMNGQPYSRAVFAQLMNRIRADSDDPKKRRYKIGAKRAALIKAYLLRKARAEGNKFKEGELTMALNEKSTNVSYHLGRLFACLEKTQSDALGLKLNATIRDRFWGAASSTPAIAFPRLISLAQHHISKDENWGRNNDKRIREVMNALPEKWPKRLTLEEQGTFAIGYYHQKQSFYTSNTEEQSEHLKLQTEKEGSHND
ncbi:type I-C CRISPR-associated protein Cas8c/Csd1 [Paenibacillus paeoniae]|uniref:Type I-C CRISPR-associated protein Cas8c/Csd1 n=1 Tax=Paenibacillus paeoniae TaxID=2292705 RepID=A0A371PJP0_9BACL|nr:type I-C CRISPR-associated protein Cas8c/Csd1 [Paenibacillus paeoniae]REK76416.1 type I-C CRISPR-associated protein Cas8c/Csd1 [Paenibacillus paeoniae]